MAKIAYSKLGLKRVDEVSKIIIFENEIEIKQYLPINDKLTLISNAINLASDDNNFINPIKLEMFIELEVIFNYTNLSFTEKQKEDLVKLYDTLKSNSIIDKVIAAMPDEEYDKIYSGAFNVSKSIYEYQNSVLGILENISQDYSNVNFDAEKLQERLGGENLSFLKDVLTKLD